MDSHKNNNPEADLKSAKQAKFREILACTNAVLGEKNATDGKKNVCQKVAVFFVVKMKKSHL